MPSDRRFPILERILSRGQRTRLSTESPNHIRYELLGAGKTAEPAVAALCQVADLGHAGEEGVYWLRADPVTLRADMSRVFLLSCGLADYQGEEWDGLDRLVRDTLKRDGLELRRSENGYWLLSLAEHPGFVFTPLHEALGRDMADTLPDHPGATAWKKRMTDIQVELHQAGFNKRRRDTGQQEINSIWFWGGGVTPEVKRAEFSNVVTGDPVSRGLALLAGSEVSGQSDFAGMEAPAFIDWLTRTSDPVREAKVLEQAAGTLLRSTAANRHGFRLVAGDGQAWYFGSYSRFRFWQTARPLSRHFSGEPGGS